MKGPVEFIYSSHHYGLCVHIDLNNFYRNNSYRKEPRSEAFGLGMTKGQIRVEYCKYLSAIIYTIAINIYPQLQPYPREENHIHIHAHQISDIHRL